MGVAESVALLVVPGLDVARFVVFLAPGKVGATALQGRSGELEPRPPIQGGAGAADRVGDLAIRPVGVLHEQRHREGFFLELRAAGLDDFIVR